MDGVVDTASFSRELADMLRARFSLIHVQTFEEDRALESIDSTAQKLGYHLDVWSASQGVRSFGKGKPGTDELKPHLKEALSDLAVALELFERKAETNKSADGFVFVLLDPYTYLSEKGANPIYRRRLRDFAVDIRTRGLKATCILISPSVNLPYELEKEISLITFPLPTLEEIKHYLTNFFERVRANKSVTLAPEVELLDGLANAMLGLTMFELQNALAKSVVDDRLIDLSDIDEIFRSKQQIVRKSGILEYIYTKNLSLELVGGLDLFKQWLRVRRLTFTPAARKFGIAMPKGVLLTGIPGCGKSLSAKCVAAAWNLPLIRLDMGRVYSSLVGSSEERMRTAIQTCEAVAPCVLWIDEIEKGVPRSSGFVGDNGVSMRVMGTFLTWLQEKTSPIFVFATANQINLLPPEMLRKGRFDEIFFVDLPRDDERREIINIHIRSSGRDPEKFDVDRLVDRSGPEQFGEGIAMTGAEIAGWVNDALIRAFDRKGVDVEMSDFEETLKTLVPLAQVRSEEIAAMHRWAETHALNASLAPNAIQRRAADMSLGGRELDLGHGKAG